MVSPFLYTLALFDGLWSFKQWPTQKSFPENSLNVNWLISCSHTAQPMNLAEKLQHEELNC
jgi:hypothetical protein